MSTKPNSCSACGGSGINSSGGSCGCGCSCDPVDCNPDVEARLCWCQKACLTEKVNPYPNDCTMCNLVTACNMFYIEQPGYEGRCILDEMTFEDVLRILSRNPAAREHMLRITSDPCLVKMAQLTDVVIPIAEQDQAFMRRINNSIPFYTLFRGNMGGDIR